MNRYEQQGVIDAQAGRTSCPYGVPAQAKAWARGHDKAVNDGLGPHPRFARICFRLPSRIQSELGL